MSDEQVRGARLLAKLGESRHAKRAGVFPSYKQYKRYVLLKKTFYPKQKESNWLVSQRFLVLQPKPRLPRVEEQPPVVQEMINVLGTLRKRRTPSMRRRIDKAPADVTL